MSFPLEGPHAADTLPPGPEEPAQNAFIAGLQSALMISHRPPKNPVLKWIWKKRMMLESTFCLIMLNLWEKLLVMSIVGLFFVLIYISIVNYLPSYLHFLRNRIAYYVFGDESVPLFNDIWSWIGIGGIKTGAGMAGVNGGSGVGEEGLMVTTRAVKVVFDRATTAMITGSNVLDKTVEVVATGRMEL